MLKLQAVARGCSVQIAFLYIHTSVYYALVFIAKMDIWPCYKMQKNVRNIPCIFYYSAFSNGIVHKEFAICIGDTFTEKNSFGVLFPTFSLSGSRTSKSKSAIVAHSSSSYFPRLFIIFPLLHHFSTLLNKQRKPKEECVLASSIYQNCVSMHLGKHKYMYMYL